jgi:hypothetical protein
LGEDRKCEIEIHWPSGTKQVLGEVMVDQKLEVKEPA